MGFNRKTMIIFGCSDTTEKIHGDLPQTILFFPIQPTGEKYSYPVSYNME